MPARRILFVTWDGPQVSYLQGLFLPIFESLKKRGHELFVLQFTWGQTTASSAGDTCRRANIPYRRVDVDRHLAGFGAFLTAIRGGSHIDRAVADWGIDLLLPRSLLPALAVLRSASGRRLPILFDADGLPADERVEFFGLNPHGATYWALRWIESAMVKRADHVLVRTHDAAKILASRTRPSVEASRFTIVTNGRASVPLPKFEKQSKSNPLWPKLVYVGSLGAQYRPGVMLELAAAMKREIPGLTFDLFSGDLGIAEAEIGNAGYADAPWLTLASLTQEELVRRLPFYDAGLALRVRSLSMTAVSPIKIGDYLMAGLPIIGTAGIGDVDELVSANVMLAVEGLEDSDRSAEWLANHILPNRENIRATCHALGNRLFSLDRSIDQYERAISLIPARKY